MDGYSIPYESINTSRATPLTVQELAQNNFSQYPAPNGTVNYYQNYNDNNGTNPAGVTRSIAEEDVQTQICKELASGKSPAPSKSKPAPSHEILEYQNKMTATSILGELLGQQKPRRLVKVIIATPESARAGLSPDEAFQRRRDSELSGLDKADRDFLYAKEVFNFPPRAVWYAKRKV